MAAHLMGPPGSRCRQQGVALLLTLLMLTAISLFGAAALRTSLFGARMAMGTGIDAMAFAGAEAAIDVTLRVLENHPERLQSLLAGNSLTLCVTRADGARPGTCGSGDHLDPQALVVAESHARVIGSRAVADGDAKPTTVEYRIAIVGEAAVARFGRHEYHLQEAILRAPGPAAEAPAQGGGLHRSGWRPLSPAEAEALLAAGGGG